MASLMAEPSPDGRFGEFGGRFVPEPLMPACIELEEAFRDAWSDDDFRAELNDALRDYAGRPSPLTECHNLGDRLGLRLLLKREDLNHTGSHPDVVVACVGGGSNAAGLFAGFVDTTAELVGAEAAGGAAIGRGVPGVVHGMMSYLMQDEHGQVLEAHSISAGLDYPGIGPEHSHLWASGRAAYEAVTDAE